MLAEDMLTNNRSGLVAPDEHRRVLGLIWDENSSRRLATKARLKLTKLAA
jgi:hypothetical protein